MLERVVLRCYNNKGLRKVMNDHFLVTYKSLTDNNLHCREFTQTIGPGPAMTLREAAVRIEVLQ